MYITFKNYLKANAYGNAEQDDLWAALTKQAHEDGTLNRSLTVKEIMDTWTLKKGYPVLQINRNGTQLKLTQKWFLLNPLNNAQNNLTEFNQYKWYIPFTFTTRKLRDFDFESKPTWFKKNDAQRI